MGHNAGILDQVIQWRSLIAHLASASQGHHFFPVFSESDGVKKRKNIVWWQESQLLVLMLEIQRPKKAMNEPK